MKALQYTDLPSIKPAIPWLLAAYTLAAAPHIPRLPVWIIALCGTLVGLRLLVLLRHYPLPSRSLLFAMTLTGAMGVYFSYGTLLGRDAGVALLILMLGLKLLELRATRDVMVIVFLSYFLVITAFLYSQTMALAVYMLAAVFLLTAALVISNLRISTALRVDVHRMGLRHAGLMLFQAAPLMILMFFLFPRVSGPIWGLPTDAYRGMTGLSDNMSPGNISNLSRSDEIAFRARFESEIPHKTLRYWRGPVMEFFDGRTWASGKPAINPTPSLSGVGYPVRYSVTLEPSNKTWLFALDIPALRPPDSDITYQYQLITRKPIVSLKRYDMLSYLQYRLPDDSVAQLANLQLPHQGSARTRQLAESWRGLSDIAIVRRALQMFRDQPFVYTLNPPLLGEDPVDEFLFVTRRGFCEHYASSFVVLMRAAGIPARVVTGYQGGEINPVDGYMTVRQSDAHAWAEVWLGQNGWTRVDPTAAVSPMRIEQGLGSALSEQESLPFILRPENAWARQLRFSWDAVTNRWNQWVLGYGPERQRQFFSNLGFPHADWRGMTTGLMLALGVITAVFIVFLLKTPKKAKPPPELLAYYSFCRKCERIGFARRPEEGPLDYSRRLSKNLPGLATKISAIISLYTDLRYGPHRQESRIKELRKLVKALRLKAKPLARR